MGMPKWICPVRGSGRPPIVSGAPSVVWKSASIAANVAGCATATKRALASPVKPSSGAAKAPMARARAKPRRCSASLRPRKRPAA